MSASSQSPGREYPIRPIASAHAIVVCEGAILLVRCAHPPSLGRWSLPGCLVEIGETIREAARREVREECGIGVEVGAVLDAVDSLVPDEAGRIRFHYVVVYLQARFVSGDARPGADAAEVMWAAPVQLGALDMHPAVRRTIIQATGGLS